jgi:hypothetical protein
MRDRYYYVNFFSLVQWDGGPYFGSMPGVLPGHQFWEYPGGGGLHLS